MVSETRHGLSPKPSSGHRSRRPDAFFRVHFVWISNIMPLQLLLSACFLTWLAESAPFVDAGLFVTHVTHLSFSCLCCLKLALRCGGPTQDDASKY